MTDGLRINKFLADQGVASRREVDALISAGKVTVNGKPAVIGQKVSSTDKVEVKGATKSLEYLAYYKGRGIITHSPGENETDIKMKLDEDYRGRSELMGVNPVGRLDKDSEGLIILTNDGRVTGPLLDPVLAHEKEYEVVVDKPINSQFLKQMARGVDIEGYTTKPAKIEQAGGKRFMLTITEGKKHQIRRMCAALGYQIQSLKRVRVMNIELGKLKPNQYRKFTPTELITFKKLLGIN